MPLTLSLLLTLITPPSATEDLIARLADSTCSNPQRAGIRARAVARVPAGGEAAFVQDIQAFIAQAGLSGGNGEGWSGSNEPSYHTNYFIIHSPRHTVLLQIDFDTRRDTIRLRVERGCFDDSPLEDWRPYWSQLIRHLRARNYVVRPISRSRRH